MKASFVYLLAGMLLAAFILVLDYQGVFIYFTYWPVYVGGVLYVGWGLRLVRAPDGSRQGGLFLLLAVLFGLLLVVVPHLPNGERKTFFLTASSIREGAPEARIRRKMRNYRLTENANGSLTFSCRSRPQTEDHFVVVLDPASRTARSVEFLAD